MIVRQESWEKTRPKEGPFGSDQRLRQNIPGSRGKYVSEIFQVQPLEVPMRLAFADHYFFRRQPGERTAVDRRISCRPSLVLNPLSPRLYFRNCAGARRVRASGSRRHTILVGGDIQPLWLWTLSRMIKHLVDLYPFKKGRLFSNARYGPAVRPRRPISIASLIRFKNPPV